MKSKTADGEAKRSTIRQAHDLQPFGSLRPDSELYPVGIDNPFIALDFRQPSLIQNPLAGCLASTLENEKTTSHPRNTSTGLHCGRKC